MGAMKSIYTREKMSREECENIITKKAKEIKEVYEAYVKDCGIEDDYLNLSIMGGVIRYNNAYWEHQDNGVIDYWEEP